MLSAFEGPLLLEKKKIKGRMKEQTKLKSNGIKAMYYGKDGLCSHKSWENKCTKVARPKRMKETLAKSFHFETVKRQADHLLYASLMGWEAFQALQ